MSNSADSPILVTYRSAEELRDAGIKYAYLKAGVFAAFWLAVFFLMCCLWLLSRSPEHPHPLAWLAFVLGISSGLVMMACGRAIEFPHCPRLTLDELEIMKNGMGLSDITFQRTHDSVIHGSVDEVRAIWKAQDLIQRLRRSSGRTD
ncbi:hypothetical protein [Acidovorax sp.]|uniref:hypothetical protein n=1 Tax=Acidovorax sp. TaxID=1872122 RepID=UPI0025BF82C4|nr:hypothetical protein [Acidovorax sp.]